MTDPASANTPLIKAAPEAGSKPIVANAATETAFVYQSLVSARSRRLRVTGLVLLVAVLGMSLYGVAVLMPSLRTLPRLAAKTTASDSERIRSGDSAAGRTGTVNRAADPRADISRSDAPRTGQTTRVPSGLSERERRVALARVLFVYGYWSVCGVLILALIVVSWLDLREVSRLTDAHRAHILAQTVEDENRESI